MSADILTQALGVAGITTGALALLVSYRTYAMAKPHLRVTTKKCTHFYNSQTLTIHPELSISNRGDRQTTLNRVEAEFTVNGIVYTQKYDFHITEFDEEVRAPVIVSKVSVDPHSTIEEFVIFEAETKGIQLNEIPCIFRIYHTHGTYEFKALSVRDRFIGTASNQLSDDKICDKYNLKA